MRPLASGLKLFACNLHAQSVVWMAFAVMHKVQLYCELQLSVLHGRAVASDQLLS